MNTQISGGFWKNLMMLTRIRNICHQISITHYFLFKLVGDPSFGINFSHSLLSPVFAMSFSLVEYCAFHTCLAIIHVIHLLASTGRFDLPVLVTVVSACSSAVSPSQACVCARGICVDSSTVVCKLHAKSLSWLVFLSCFGEICLAWCCPTNLVRPDADQWVDWSNSFLETLPHS